LTTETEEKILCAGCFMAFGAGKYIGETPEHYAGDKPLCEFCAKEMERLRYIQVNMIERLLPDGTFVPYRPTVAELVASERRPR
jgi:hypothetical protein